jgi:riboflavin kinase/FMN adenylyltransferase
MQIFRGISSFNQTPLALTIGNFDGVHLGHQALLNRLKQVALAQQLTAAVMVFEPHAREFFTPETAPARLSSLREKLEYFAAQGIERVYVCRFNEQLANTSATDFMLALILKLDTKYILVGDDFRFGSGRGGDFSLLQHIAHPKNVRVDSMPSLLQADIRISSTAVRHALQAGNLALARQYLGRPYRISGHVEHGNKVGRELGYPTANIQLKHNRAPITGIFVVEVRIEGQEILNGVASLGVRPTVVNEGKPVLEVYLFDFKEEIYGRHLQVNFLHKLRNEAKFPNLAQLIEQIEMDVTQAKQWFSDHPKTLNEAI